MIQWGNNPATWQAIASIISAIGIIALFISAFLAWRTYKIAKARRTAIEREMTYRLRPWIGLFCAKFIPSGKGDREEVLKLQLKNIGSLPAQNGILEVKAFPVFRDHKEPNNAIRRPQRESKTLFPNEDINYSIELFRYKQFKDWRINRRDILVEGTMNYMLDDSNYESKFEVKILLSQSESIDDNNVPILYRNIYAS
jgi:hypothetical protein